MYDTQTRTRKIILIGKTGSGKTTLIQRIENRELEYHKTQTVQSHMNFIDTPGEYLENRTYYKALLVTSADADVIGLVQDASSDETWLPPMFSMAFAKESIGIVTKCDLAEDEEAIRRAERRLRDAGACRIFRVSSVLGDGVDELVRYMNG